MKMDSSVLKKKSSFEMLGLPFSSTLDCGSYIISLIKTVFKKIEALIHFIKFISSGKRLLCISTNLPYGPHGIMSCLAWCRNVGPSLATSLEPLANC